MQLHLLIVRHGKRRTVCRNGDLPTKHGANGADIQLLGAACRLESASHDGQTADISDAAARPFRRGVASESVDKWAFRADLTWLGS